MIESFVRRPQATKASAALLSLLVLFGPGLAAQQSSRNPQQEAAVERELAKAAPAAVSVFKAATSALDAGRHSEAVSLFQQVLGQAPRFSPALRRLGYCLLETGPRDAGLAYLEAALQVERTPENLFALATSLFWVKGGETPSRSDAERALPLAQEAVTRNRDERDSSYLVAATQIALFLQRYDDVRAAAAQLMNRFPQEFPAHYFAAIIAAVDGKWARAEREITEAQRLGLPAGIAEQFLSSGVRRGARLQRGSWWALGIMAAWAAGLVFLYAAGKTLSGRILRSIDNRDPDADVSPAERSLRQTYRRLIGLAGTYYYVSLPFVMAAIAMVTGLIIYFFMAIGWLPIGLLYALVIGALLTMFKMVQTLFIKLPVELPGRHLEREEAPGLWALAAEVAQAVGTRTVDEIRITPGTEMAVYEKGSRRERHEDRSQRVLLVGVGLLDGFRQGPFCAVLAHEYGHFAHRDTAGGDVALRVGRDMQKLAHALVNSGQAVWWNVACHFIALYAFLFRRIAHGATRLQEVLADRVAARRYGASNFEEGLRHVVRRHVEFGTALQLEVQQAVERRRPINNVYEAQPHAVGIEQAVHDALNRPTDEDDTHPCPMERFELIRGTVASGTTPDGLVWELFANRTALVGEMIEGFNVQISSLVTPDPVTAPA